MRAQLLVLAKRPLPGRAKTRLVPALSVQQAADVARAALLDTLDSVLAVPAVRHTLVLDGPFAGHATPPRLPAELRTGGSEPAVLAQRRGDLGARLAGAFSDAYAALPLPMLLVGMDTPQVTPSLLTAALEALLGTGAVLGLAEDGGWWALGVHAPVPGLFDGVPMSTDRAGAVQRARLDACGLPVAVLPTLRDLDHVEDVAAVAALQPPGARLPALAAALGLRGAPAGQGGAA